MPVKAMLAPIYNPSRSAFRRVLGKGYPLERYLAVALAGMRIASGRGNIAHPHRLCDLRLVVNPHLDALVLFHMAVVGNI